MDQVVSSCLHCGKPVTSSTRGRPSKFCGDAHRKAYGRLNGQNSPKQPITFKTQNHDTQPIDIVEGICPESRAHFPPWKRINECTWKLTRGHVTAYVMNVAPEANHPHAWIARVGEYACSPTTLGEAKSTAAQMIRGLPGDWAVDDGIYFLNQQAEGFFSRPEDKPHIAPVPQKGIKVHLGISGHRKLQILGCGFRVVTVRLRGKNVILHHNGKTAVIERKDFKELLAANRAYRMRH